MKPVTITVLKEELKDLREELKISFKENNKFIFKQVKTDIKNAVEENNKSIFKYIKQNNKVLVKRIDGVVNARLSEASDAILHTIDTNHDEANQKFDTVIKKIDKNSTDINFMHQDLKNIVTDMSDKPSRRQFEEFKSSFKNYPVL